MDAQRGAALQSIGARDLSRRTIAGGLAGGGALAALLAALGSGRAGAAIQDATPEPLAAGPILNAIFTDLPAAPVEVSISRSVTQPGEGDLDDILTFPGPVAFIVEQGVLTCRCGTAENPCMIIHATGAGEPAPPWPAEIDLHPGEGLYIPFNVPDSFLNRGDVPEVEIDLLIAPAQGGAGGAMGTPQTTPTS
jgi:hypothetical protein